MFGITWWRTQVILRGMAKVAFFQPFSGASGDMALGALVDAGVPLAQLEENLRTLQVKGWRLEHTRVYRGAFAASRVRVVLEHSASDRPGHEHRHTHGHGHSHEHEHRHVHGHSHGHEHPHTHEHQHGHEHRQAHDPGHEHTHSHAHSSGPQAHAHAHSHGDEQRNLPRILEIIEQSGLPVEVQENARRVFTRLGEAEAHVHGMPIEEVHFHEVGAVDSIVDIVGACVGLHLLGIDAVYSAPITVGTGYVMGDHGQMPLPAPATTALLRGFPIEQRDSRAELTTPTGAALLTTLASGFGTMPRMTLRAVGYGAGDDRPGPVPNVLRLLVGETTASATEADRVVVLETNIDDMSPEWLGHLTDRLLNSGASDVWLTPILMKKGTSRARTTSPHLTRPRVGARGGDVP